MPNIKKMSIDDILNTTGIAIGGNQVLNVLKNTEDIDLQSLKNIQLAERHHLINFLRLNEHCIDKEKLVFCTALNFRDQINRRTLKSEEEETKYREKFQKCLELLKGSKVEFPEIKRTKDSFKVNKFFTMKDLLNQKKDDIIKREENKKRLEEIDKEISLGKILAILSPQDYSEFIFAYPGNADVMDYIVRMNVGEMKETYIMNNPDADEITIQNNMVKMIVDSQKEFIENYADKIDVDKLLLIAAYRAKILMKESQVGEEDRDILTEIMEIGNRNIVNPKSRIAGELQIHINEQYRNIIYSAERLKEDVTRIFEGRYYSKEEIFNIKKDILSGELELSNVVDKELFKLLNFNKKDKLELIGNDPKNFEYLIMFDEIEQEELSNALNKIGDFKLDKIIPDFLHIKGMINKKDIFNMYMKRNIDLPKVIALNKKYSELSPEMSVEELMNYYIQMKESENKIKDFDRYSLLFRELKLKGKNQAEQNNIEEQIVEEIYKLDGEYSEDFKSLYKSDLLSIRTLIDWNGDGIIYDLIQNKSLKPKDAKTLLMTGELDVRKAYDALRNSNLSDAEKMNFIFSSFDGVGKTEEEIKAQTDARMYLIQAIKISKDLNIVEKTEDITHHKRGKGAETVKANQYVTDPVYRWQLFSKIDENCTSEVSSDGTVIFTLPTVNNGTVVVEKMFKSTKNGVKINYGSATYAMSQEEFLNHKAEIEQNGKINRRVLIQMQEEGAADKLVHSSGWGRSLKKNLGLSVENGYSEERIAEIDNLVDRIEKARELVD